MNQDFYYVVSMRTLPEIMIRPIELTDADAVQRYAADARLAATCNVPHPYPPDGGWQFVQRSVTARERGERYPSAVIVGQQFAGIMGLNCIDAEGGTAELDYWIAVPFWHQGVATAAAQLAVKLAFERLMLRTVFSGCWIENPASCRVLTKVGFTEVKAVMNDGTFGQKFKDQLVRRFRLDQSDWKQGIESGTCG